MRVPVAVAQEKIQHKLEAEISKLGRQCRRFTCFFDQQSHTTSKMSCGDDNESQGTRPDSYLQKIDTMAIGQMGFDWPLISRGICNFFKFQADKEDVE